MMGQHLPHLVFDPKVRYKLVHFAALERTLWAEYEGFAKRFRLLFWLAALNLLKEPCREVCCGEMLVVGKLGGEKPSTAVIEARDLFPLLLPFLLLLVLDFKGIVIGCLMIGVRLLQHLNDLALSPIIRFSLTINPVFVVIIISFLNFPVLVFCVTFIHPESKVLVRKHNCCCSTTMKKKSNLSIEVFYLLHGATFIDDLVKGDPQLNSQS